MNVPISTEITDRDESEYSG